MQAARNSPATANRASQMKTEKESQMSEEAWRNTLKTNRIGKAKAKPDPF